MKQVLKNIEIWGGVECTINRVNDEYFDQLEYAGHYNREGDIKLFAELGIKKIRYPILWEKHQPNADGEIDWTLTAKRLQLLNAFHIDVIAGLVHHGSGPACVNMAGDTFVEGLAAYAGEVAKRFPWINYYTPVNEPLTTARFCGLYGIWYPHLKNDQGFCRILINECRATVLAMQAVRKVNPAAKLIQTEDLGETHSTTLLQYQADFENHRRWLTFDLLSGKVDSTHALSQYLIDSGIQRAELDFFIENKCAPDILGLNHYVTSERYLDENLQGYPEHTHGGNSWHRYADVEAVRVGNATPKGPYNLLKEAWDRHQLPIAVTEVHLHCTREEQMRWLNTLWNAAKQLTENGVDIRAITPWALLGSFGWNRLLTVPDGDYEAGVFDLTLGEPRRTALANMVAAYSLNNSYKHALIEGHGWWQRSGRAIYNKNDMGGDDRQKMGKPLLVIGRSGTLGNAFAHVCDSRGIHHEIIGRPVLDITNALQLEKIILEKEPWGIVNTAGYVRVDDAEMEPENCFALNTDGVAVLAALCNKYGIKLLTFSTDLVFNGSKSKPYTEADGKAPLNVYGQSKALAEEQVIKFNRNALIIRTSAFFGPWDNHNFITVALNSLQRGDSFTAINDVLVSPTYVPDLANASLDLMIDDEKGVWHLTNKGQISWSDLAFSIAERGGYKSELIKPKPLDYFNLKAKRPVYSVLSSRRGNMLSTLDAAIDRYFVDKG